MLSSLSRKLSVLQTSCLVLTIPSYSSLKNIYNGLEIFSDLNR